MRHILPNDEAFCYNPARLQLRCLLGPIPISHSGRKAHMPAAAEHDRVASWRKAVPASFALLVVLSFGGTFVYKLRVEGIFACPANGYDSNAYLSDCNVRTYGVYDHGAFWFGLEPRAQRAV